jgi:hypothetical protein
VSRSQLIAANRRGFHTSAWNPDDKMLVDANECNLRKHVEMMMDLDRGDGQVFCPIVDDFILTWPPKECPYRTEHAVLLEAEGAGDAEE